MKNIKGAILVTADIVGLYPSISHGASVEALQKNKGLDIEI